MQSIINVQLELNSKIKKGLKNYKKSPSERITKEYVEARLENLDDDWALFRTNHSKLHETANPAELSKTSYIDSEVYDDTEEAYLLYKSTMKVALSQLLPKETGLQPQPQSRSVNNCENPSSLVRLPKISIPTFLGLYSEWNSFRDLFISLVHNNTMLDNVQKLHYLKTHLSGEAAQLIKHTPITDANYSQCWSLLDKRYNNKKYLANCILKRLFGQRRLNVESASGLKELLDTSMDCMSALKNINVNVSTWDIIVIHIITYKFDTETRKQWELHISNVSDSNDLPTLDQLQSFMENRFRALEFIDSKRPVGQQTSGPSNRPKALLATNATVMRCEFCSENHKLCFCKKFAKQECQQRRDFVAKNSICFNCLGSNHTVYECRKPTTCRICRRRHHSLLHPDYETEANVPKSKEHDEKASSSVSSGPVVSYHATQKVSGRGQVLLATALVNAESSSGANQMVRVLMDQGSQACFITEAAVQLLRLKKTPVKGVISGLGGDHGLTSKSVVTVTIRSRSDKEFTLKIRAYVLRNITSNLPEHEVHTINWIDLQNMSLADPEFNIPSKIDLLLGANVYSQILRDGVKRSPSGTLIAQRTSLGWILSGMVQDNNQEQARHNISVMHTQFTEDNLLKRFWEIEELGTKHFPSEEEQKCEDNFLKTTQRQHDGRYIVTLPFREEPPSCLGGNSRQIAVAKFKVLEKRLAKDADLKKNYTEVINEYLKLDHMRPVKKDDNKKDVAVYLPHHAVVRNDKTTSKVRVVFNASSKNNNQVSLNDTLMIGPKLQPDLRHTVTRWREHPIALVADIIKMYRQVKIAEKDTIYQRIVWRDEPEEEIKDYELVTVTFGTSSAPYLAVRALNQVSFDESSTFPLASPKVLQSFYMDDLMTGCSDVKEGAAIYKEMTELLLRGGFQLQKWNSNNKELLLEINKNEFKGNQNKEYLQEKDVPIKNKEQNDKDKVQDIKNKHKIKEQNDKNKNQDIKDKHKNKGQNYKDIQQDTKDKQQDTKDKQKNIQDKDKEIKDKMDIDTNTEHTTKILGLTWDRSEDHFQYTVNMPASATASETKRSIISIIARLYDPLGWIAPTIVIAKMFIQKLWLAGTNWDEPISTELQNEWNTYHNELVQLTSVKVPRWLGTSMTDTSRELHGFSDASKLAYSAVVYIRTVDSSGNIQVSLLAAKTKVAPIKQISIPRLELCGAVLLSQLLTEVAEVLKINKQDIKAWTDSTVVLAWLNSHPSRWQTFVANRVSTILTTLDSSQWYHVTSKNNPADCASRGIQPGALADNELWFKGPSFLREPDIIYAKPKNLKVNLEEAPVKSHFSTLSEDTLIQRFSSLQRLLRVIAYCRRFYKRNPGQNKYITKLELDQAMVICIKKVQLEEFNEDYESLQAKGRLSSKKSKLNSLCPYLDNDGIMRVSGRIQKSQLSNDTKHPIIMSHSSHLTKLIVLDAHQRTLHGGIQLMINFLRSKYWILGVKSLVKQHIRKCVSCVRQNAKVQNPFMGSLPSVRCTPARAFLNSAVDYAGPIQIRTSKGRGNRSYKGYISLFICMATRAIHLEVVSDMSTQAFLAACRRFVSRRGHCAQLWSDNGTTFVGASKELEQIYKVQNDAAEHLESQGTEWHFIPPRAPNFGGLWEAGVKSTKYHLKRVIGESTLTFEEMSTLLTQIEACLNSRPITVDTSNPNEPLPLSPGHFLIGEPLISLPDSYNYLESNISLLTRWQVIQRMLQSFWRRWSQEYLTNLMNRYKWNSRVPEPNIGDIVLIKEDDLPPSRWLMGRIVDKHPGSDNVTRVVTIKVKQNMLKRPTSKLCVLPVND